MCGMSVIVRAVADLGLGRITRVPTVRQVPRWVITYITLLRSRVAYGFCVSRDDPRERRSPHTQYNAFIAVRLASR